MVLTFSGRVIRRREIGVSGVVLFTRKPVPMRETRGSYVPDKNDTIIEFHTGVLQDVMIVYIDDASAAEDDDRCRKVSAGDDRGPRAINRTESNPPAFKYNNIIYYYCIVIIIIIT